MNKLFWIAFYVCLCAGCASENFTTTTNYDVNGKMTSVVKEMKVQSHFTTKLSIESLSVDEQGNIILKGLARNSTDVAVVVQFAQQLASQAAAAGLLAEKQKVEIAALSEQNQKLQLKLAEKPVQKQ